MICKEAIPKMTCKPHSKLRTAPLYQCSLGWFYFSQLFTYFSSICKHICFAFYIYSQSLSKIKKTGHSRFYSPWVFPLPQRRLLICRILLLFFSLLYFNFPPLLLCILNNNECFLSSHCPLTYSHSQQKRKVFEASFIYIKFYQNVLSCIHRFPMIIFP